MNLRTQIWVQALIRRAEVGGASAFVTRRGDPDHGSVMVKIAMMDRRGRVLVPRFATDGARAFADITAEGVSDAEAALDDFVRRQISFDPDLWVVEIEDKAGRHFLTEPVLTDVLPHQKP